MPIRERGLNLSCSFPIPSYTKPITKIARDIDV